MAEDRKARLAALAARAGRTSNPDAEEPAATATDGADRPAVRFRNYAPKDAALEGGGGGGAGAEAAAGITSKMDVDGDAGAPVTKRQRTENITGSSGSGSGGNKKGEKPMSALEEAMLQAKAEASALSGGVGGVGGVPVRPHPHALSPQQPQQGIRG